MYSVIDQKTVPQVADKDAAFVLVQDLKRDNPDGDWQAYGTVSQTDDNEVLERMYALCSQLLIIAGINPMKLEMKTINLLEEETVYTAAKIMFDARAALDELQ